MAVLAGGGRGGSFSRRGEDIWVVVLARGGGYFGDLKGPWELSVWGWVEIFRYWSSSFKESVMILVRGAAPACMLATWPVGICGAKWRAVICLLTATRRMHW